jgi:hypothetical protein
VDDLFLLRLAQPVLLRDKRAVFVGDLVDQISAEGRLSGPITVLLADVLVVLENGEDLVVLRSVVLLVEIALEASVPAVEDRPVAVAVAVLVADPVEELVGLDQVVLALVLLLPWVVAAVDVECGRSPSRPSAVQERPLKSSSRRRSRPIRRHLRLCPREK